MKRTIGEKLKRVKAEGDSVLAVRANRELPLGSRTDNLRYCHINAVTVPALPTRAPRAAPRLHASSPAAAARPSSRTRRATPAAAS